MKVAPAAVQPGEFQPNWGTVITVVFVVVGQVSALAEPRRSYLPLPDRKSACRHSTVAVPSVDQQSTDGTTRGYNGSHFSHQAIAAEL